MKRILGVLLAATLALPLFVVPTQAYVPDKTPRRLLEAQVRREIANSPASAALPGVVVMRGGRTLLAINDQKPMAPASLLKLATTITAMKLFGPEHRFKTSFVAAAPAVGGTIAGPVALVGGGDPTLATAAYRSERFIGRPKPHDPHPIPAFAGGSPSVEDLAARIAGAGVRRIVGDVVVDDSIFDGARTQPGWIPDYIGKDPETGYIDGLTINEGFTDTKGTGILSSPALSAGNALKTALAKRGVVVTGSVRRGIAPKGSRALAAVQSPPLSEIVFYTNRWSINYSAELLLKNIGASFGGAGTTEAGASVVERTLRQLHIPTEGLRQEDGSGLSLLDRIEPSTIAAMLRYMLTLKDKAGDALRNSLPVAAGPGTLWTRFRGTPAAGNLRGKTGSIRHVRSLAGWVTPLDGVPVVYVLMFNDVARPSLLTSPLDFIGLLLTRYPDP